LPSFLGENIYHYPSVSPPTGQAGSLVNPVPSTYVHGFGALPFVTQWNIHPDEQMFYGIHPCTNVPAYRQAGMALVQPGNIVNKTNRGHR